MNNYSKEPAGNNDDSKSIINETKSDNNSVINLITGTLLKIFSIFSYEIIKECVIIFILH